MIKQIDRIRRRRPRDVVLDEISKVPADQHSPTEVAEQRELHDSIVNAIRSLPTPQREVVTLFYIGTYSQNDISAFLGVPVSTVKMRLFHQSKCACSMREKRYTQSLSAKSRLDCRSGVRLATLDSWRKQ